MGVTKKLVIADLLSSFLMLLDLIADVAFLSHLWRNDLKILFFVAATFLIISLIIVNFLAGIGILELSRELGKAELKSLGLDWLWERRIFIKWICAVIGLTGLLPHVIVCLNCIALKRAKESEDEDTMKALTSLLQEDNAMNAVKEVQSVAESGIMIYIKCFYIFLNALLYTKNWPLLLGLSFNVISLFFGLRNDMISVKKWPFIAIIVAFVNLALRIIINLVLATATKAGFFFIPIGISILLMFIWGLTLRLKFPLISKSLDELASKVAPKSMMETVMSSFMYTLFLVPVDIHTAVSVLPIAFTSIAVACLEKVPLGLRIIMPFAGILGQVPPKLWWKLAKIEKD